MQNNELKLCKKCKLTKPSTAFNKNSKTNDKLSTNCKSCANEISTEWTRIQRQKKLKELNPMNI